MDKPAIKSPKEEVFDIESALQRLDGDKQLYSDLFSLFIIELPKLISNLTTALSNQNIEAIATAAHTLRGAAENLGANSITNFCRQIENCCHKHGTFADYQQLIERAHELQREIESVS